MFIIINLYGAESISYYVTDTYLTITLFCSHNDKKKKIYSYFEFKWLSSRYIFKGKKPLQLLYKENILNSCKYLREGSVTMASR